MSAAAVILDLDAGEELFAKNASAVRPIASISKLFVALAVREKGLPLEGQTVITEEDRRHAQGGARSRLPVGKAFRNIDLLRAMLISSDNRACTAVGRGAGMSPRELIAAMNAKARELGLKRTTFTDPSGLNGNVSTPREIIVALHEVLADPVLKEILATPSVVVQSTSKPGVGISYASTNLPLRAGNPAIIGGKTGYTDEARYCLAIAAELAGRRIGMVFLGAEGELTRFADLSRASHWILSGAWRKKRTVSANVGVAYDPPRAMTPKLAH